jgi:hypothetical protein
VSHCRSQWPSCPRVGVRSLAWWYFGFESRRGHGCLSVVNVVCCQVEVSATSWSLVQGVLQTVVLRCVWSRNLKNEEAMTRVGPQRHMVRAGMGYDVLRHTDMSAELSHLNLFILGYHERLNLPLLCRIALVWITLFCLVLTYFNPFLICFILISEFTQSHFVTETFQAGSQHCEKWLLAASHLSVCWSDRKEQLASHWTDFHEILYWLRFEDVEKIQISLKSYKNNGYLHEDLLAFMIISRWIFLRMRNFSDKFCRENQSTHLFRISFLLWDNMKKYGRAIDATHDNTAHAHCMPDN